MEQGLYKETHGYRYYINLTENLYIFSLHIGFVSKTRSVELPSKPDYYVLSEGSLKELLP